MIEATSEGNDLQNNDTLILLKRDKKSGIVIPACSSVRF